MQMVGNVAKNKPASKLISSEAYKTIQLQQLYQIQERLRSDLLACDARLSLFVAAANSCHYEALLRPCPKEFLNDNRRPNIDAILNVVDDIDRLDSIYRQLAKGNFSCFNINAINLLHTVLVRHGERVALSTLRVCEFDALYRHLRITPPQVKPTLIFEVTPSLKCDHTKDYSNLREKYTTRIGYYAGKLEHLYAMLTVGSLPKDESLKLCCNLEDALQMCRYSPSWGGSRCGAVLGCVAVVEYVMKPMHVLMDEDDSHVIINDDSCMQISYLMFFGKSCQQYGRAVKLQPKFPINWNATAKWMKTNRYSLSLGIYMMMITLTSSSGRGVFHRLAMTGLYVLRKGFFQI